MPKGLRILHLSLGERNLTHFGGIFLIHQFCKRLRLKWYLQKQISFSPESEFKVLVSSDTLDFERYKKGVHDYVIPTKRGVGEISIRYNSCWYSITLSIE